MTWRVTQLYSDVVPCPTRGRRAVRLSEARLPSAGEGSGLETKRSAHSARTSPFNIQDFHSFHEKLRDLSRSLRRFGVRQGVNFLYEVVRDLQ